MFIFQKPLEEVEAQFRKTAQWRKKMGVDLLRDWRPPEDLRKFFPGKLSD